MTAYPAATTVTVTSGRTATTILPETTDIVVAPSVVPAYAKTACTPSGIASARFASACSCAGVTETTTTAPVPTATVVVPVNPSPVPYCNAPGTGPGTGGCSAGCYCDARPGSTTVGLCDNAQGYCGDYPSCSSDADCSAGSACIAQSQVAACGGCVPYSGCSSSYVPSKRSLLAESVLDIGSMAAPLVKKNARVLRKEQTQSGTCNYDTTTRARARTDVNH